MTTRVHRDETAPRHERYRVLRGVDAQEYGGRWITVESFPTEREAKAFAQGLAHGWGLALLGGKTRGLIERTGVMLREVHDRLDYDTWQDANQFAAAALERVRYAWDEFVAAQPANPQHQSEEQ